MDSTFSEFNVTNIKLSDSYANLDPYLRIDSEFASLEREAILERRDN